jgi:hypothetical protein
MVEQIPTTRDEVLHTQGDGLIRTVEYARLRTDKPARPGYSAELISSRITNPKHFDDLDSVPLPQASPELDTFLKLFKRNVAEHPNENFLGTRQKLPPT